MLHLRTTTSRKHTEVAEITEIFAFMFFTQVQKLLDLLAPFYFVRLGGGEEGSLRIYPYHKSVRDWLTGQGEQRSAGLQFSINVQHGHSILGRACFNRLKQASPLASQQSGSNSSGNGASMLKYALRYGVAHLGKAGVFAELETLVLDFAGLWQRAYAAGGALPFMYVPSLQYQCLAHGQMPGST